MTETDTTAVIADDVPRPTVDEDAQGQLVREAVRDIARGGLRGVCFVGCGGSYFGAGPSHYLLEQRVAAYPALRMNADEFNWRRPPIVGERSLVVVASHSGGTPETVRAVQTARALGAEQVIAVSGAKDSALAQAADHSFVYHHDLASSSQARLYGHLTHAILEVSQVESEAEAAEATGAYDTLTRVLYDAILAVDADTRKAAELLTSASLSFILGAGPDEDIARCLSMCYLQEMQWLNSEAFNAGEFFHGAFEVVTQDDPAIVVMMGEHAARPMEERAVRFIERYSKKFALIDTKTVVLDGIPERFRAELSPHILNAIAGRISKLCEEITGHSLKTRRYMGEVDY
jgi:fructoselysine-6-P-deglycase FrlB-like protein